MGNVDGWADLRSGAMSLRDVRFAADRWIIQRSHNRHLREQCRRKMKGYSFYVGCPDPSGRDAAHTHLHSQHWRQNRTTRRPRTSVSPGPRDQSLPPSSSLSAGPFMGASPFRATLLRQSCDSRLLSFHSLSSATGDTYIRLPFRWQMYAPTRVGHLERGYSARIRNSPLFGLVVAELKERLP